MSREDPHAARKTAIRYFSAFCASLWPPINLLPQGSAECAKKFFVVALFSYSRKIKETAMKDPVFVLCDNIRETSFSLHSFLRHGHLEKVYENGLAHRLRKKGLKAVQQHPLAVYDEDGTLLGEYLADLFVEDSLIVELKACKTLSNEHVAQLLGYLRACRIEHGLLINFGSPTLQIKKYVLS